MVVPAASPLGIHAPSLSLPLIFVVTGLLALFTGMGWLVAQPNMLATYHYNQTTIALTHLFVLGWLCSVVMGAMYQLVPVALETKLYSERLARGQFVFHVAGFAGMVWMFRIWNMKQVGNFGALLTVGVILFVYNIARTLLRVPKWNVIATAVAAALVWLSLTVTAGLLIATAKYTATINLVSRFNPLSAMHAHAHLGVVGFFLMLIVGVSYKLIPMFTLSELQNRRRAAWSVILLNLGLAGSFVTVLMDSRWKPAFALVVILAFALYGWELMAMLRARKRRALDWGVKYFLTAIGLLVPASGLALVLSWPGWPLNTFTGQLENVYGFLGLVGVVSFAIMGMLYKIIPFLVWFGAYSKHVGHARVPALAEMYSTRLQAAGYWTYLGGLAATMAATLSSNATAVRWGCGLLALSLALLAINIGKILSHAIRPRLTPLAKPSINRITL
ncbi:MAG TPA: hypothetical protein VKS19_09195 [Verrucomicrobiae bacterium]|nr:hypothetical protein [Verrucomicrobiae bacterium]